MFSSDWWSELDTFAQILWIIALSGSGLFIIQTISAFMMGDTDSAFGDSDDLVEGDSGVAFQFFTFRNAVIFFTMFGWVGLGFYTEGYSKWIATGVGVLAGLVMMFVMAWLMKQLGKLKQDGSMRIENAIGSVGTVYLPIPAQSGGTGKVQIVIQGSTHEIDAITSGEETLATGTTVQVESVRPGNVLVVTKLV